MNTFGTTFELSCADTSPDYGDVCDFAAKVYEAHLTLRPVHFPRRFVVARQNGAIQCVGGFHFASESSPESLLVEAFGAREKPRFGTFLRHHDADNRAHWSEITCFASINPRLTGPTLGHIFYCLEAYGQRATLNVLTRLLRPSLTRYKAPLVDLCEVDSALLPSTTDAFRTAFVENYLSPQRKPTCTGIAVNQMVRNFFTAAQAQLSGWQLGNRFDELITQNTAAAA